MNLAPKPFVASVDSLEPIRTFVTEACVAAGADKKKTYALCLAIDEIATNVIKYGYPKVGLAEGEGELDVSVTYDAQQLQVVLEDNAIAFDPFQHRVPDQEDMSKPMEERPIGGLGILLARQSVDELKYEYVEGKNRNIFLINLT